VFNPLALLLFSQLSLFIGVGAVIPSIPLYGKEIGLSGAANGVVISAPAVALLLLANTSGNLADQARKPAMMWGMALIVLSDLGTAMATTLPTLIVARLGLGAGRGISEAGERGLLADLAGRVPALRGRSLAAQQAVVALGIAIGAPLGGIVVEQYGPRASFLCVSAAAFVALCCYFFLPETVGTSDSQVAASDKDSEKNDIVEWTTLLQDNQWRGLALCQSGASFGFAAKISSIPIIAADTLPGGAIGAGALLSAAGLSGLLGAPLGGLITDRAGARFAAVASGIVSAAALILIPLSLSPALLSIIPQLQDFSIGDMGGTALAFASLVVVWSTAVAAQGPAMTAFAQELAPLGSEATSMALPRAAGDGTYIVAPFILGLATDYFVDMRGAECAVAGSAALLGAMALGFFGKATVFVSKQQ
jgi:MFS family permease